MSYRTSTIALRHLSAGTGIAAAAFAQSAPDARQWRSAYQVTATTAVYRFRRPEAANELASMDFCRRSIDP